MLTVSQTKEWVVSDSYRPTDETALLWLYLITQHEPFVVALERRGVEDYYSHFTLLMGHIMRVFDGVEQDEIFERAQTVHSYGKLVSSEISQFIFQALALTIFVDTHARLVQRTIDFRIVDHFINTFALKHGMAPPAGTFTVRAQDALHTLQTAPITGLAGIGLVDGWLCTPDAARVFSQKLQIVRFNTATILTTLKQYVATEPLHSTLDALDNSLR